MTASCDQLVTTNVVSCNLTPTPKAASSLLTRHFVVLHQWRNWQTRRT